MDGNNAIDYILSNDIDGDLVECGIDTARQQLIWITSLQKRNEKRHIHMFDTFSGMSKPTENDYLSPEYDGNDCMKKTFPDNTSLLEYWKQNRINDETNKWCYTPLDEVQRKLNLTGYDSNYLHYIRGDVLETLKQEINIPTKISMLRLDTDWYESTKMELEVLFKNVSTGGVVVFDDYYLWNGQKKAVDDYLKQNDLLYDIKPVDKQTAYFIK